MAKEIEIVPIGGSVRSISEAVDDQVDAGLMTSLDGIKNFKDCDVVFGPDGTRYEPKFIASVVEDAISTINIINDGVIKDFLASLPFVYTFGVPTMATDGKHIFMNPGFIMELLDFCDGSPIGVAFVIIHEVYHNLFKHQMREAADPEKFTDHRKCNIAQDYEINWVIEHSYPDKRSEQEAEDEGESVLDENGNRVQLFAGITDTCKGLIDEKFRNTVWEEIYDQLDGTEGEPENNDDEEVEEIDFSDEYKDGFKEGVEDAIRTLRAKGLVESVRIADKLLLMSCALNEGKKTIMQGTYDDGYNEGYNRVMQQIQSLLNGGQQGGGQGGGQLPQKEVEIPGLPTIKPKFKIPNIPQQQGSSSQKNMPKIELPKTTQQSGQGNGKSGDGNDSGSQGNQQNGQGQGQGGQQGGQQGQQGGQPGGQQGGQGGQQGGQTGGQQGGQGGQQGGGQGGGTQDNGGGSSDGQGNDTGSLSNTGNGAGPTGKPTAGRTPNGTGNDNGSGGNGGMPTDVAKDIMDGITSSQDADNKLKTIGVAKNGYSGKGGAQGNHVITADEGRKLAKEAGFDDGSDSEVYMGKDDPFQDKDAIRRALAGLKKASTVLGSNGTPGCGMFDNIDSVLVSLYKPSVNWKKMLERYMKGFQSKLMDLGYSKKGIIYGRYNRFKDYEGETADRILICIDTSGSVICSGDYLRHIVADCAEIVCKLGIHKTSVIQFCDGVYKDVEFTKRNVPPAKEFTIDANQSGGTSFMPVFKYIRNNYELKHKNFQAVIFFTDDDVYSCTLPKISEIKKYANRIIWVVLDDRLKKLPYGKVIAISPDDFSSQLSKFETTEDSDFEDIDENITNESYIGKCMNKKIYTMNEGVFGNHKLAGQQRAAAKAAAAQAAGADDGSAEVPARTSTPAPKKKVLSVMDKRKLAIDALRASGAREGVMAAAKQELYTNLKPWFEKFFPTIKLFKDEAELSNDWRKPDEYAVITDFNTVDFHGNLKLVGPVILENWPEGLTFENVFGNLDVGMCSTINHLPKGLPMTVRGDFRITNLRRLENLDGCPVYVDGNMIVTACPKLDSLFGAPKRCGFFYSDKYEQEDYLNYVAETWGIKESLSLRKTMRKPLNEAFKANKLTELAKIPANRPALQAMKDIKVIWSEIPDEIINPIYNNVARSLAKRRDDNASGEYGIYIWCDNSNKINIIGTGNNMKQWGQGRSWLYLADGVMDTINQRINLVRRACNGSSSDADECIELGIKYDNQNISKIARQGSINQSGLTYTHLLFIPDLCSKAYLIQGTKDPRSSSSDNKVAHFSYDNSRDERANIQRERAKAITDVIVQGRNLNPKDPAYQKYYEQYFITDEKLIKKFILVRSIFDFRTTINEMTTAIGANAKKVRTAILGLQDDPNVDEDTFDGLYRAYTSAYVRKFKTEANTLLAAVDEIISNKKYKDPRIGDTIEQINAALELAYGTDDPTSSWGKRGRYNDLYYKAADYKNMVKWVKTYSETISTFASIMAAIDNIRKGDIAKLRDFAAGYLQ